MRSKADTFKTRGRRLLKQHIKAYWDSQAQFAEAIGVTPLVLSHFLTGRLMPKLGNAIAIELLTEKKGKPIVRCRDWVEES